MDLVMSLSMTKKKRKRLLKLLFFLPAQQKIIVDRWLRGREEFRKLVAADCIIVSLPKSGRTWLRVMLSHVYQLRHGLPHHHLLEFDNCHYQNATIPKIFFTHDHYRADYTRRREAKTDFYDKPVILWVRDPRDVAVSQFFHWKYRMAPAKKKQQLNGVPPEGKDVSVGTFVLQDVSRIMSFMNSWAQELPRLSNILVLSYEETRNHPEEMLRRILAFIGAPGTDEEIQKAVTFASYENMKKLEEEGVFQSNGRRLVPVDRKNPDSYKVRRAKVGGYQDYLTDQEVVEINDLVNSQLSPVYGYGDGKLHAPLSVSDIHNGKQDLSCA